MGQLDGQVALVTGAASGIGRAIATLFVAEGARVVMVDRNAPALTDAATHLDAPERVRAVVADVRSVADMEAAVARAVDEFGGVDVVVANAGIPSVRRIEDLTLDEFDEVIAVNLRGVFVTVKAAVPALRARGGGRIVTLGSEMGIVAVPESPAYNASKGGVMMLTRSLALDLIRYDIRVNALCPGITQTPLLEAEVTEADDPVAAAEAQRTWAPIGRVADPAEIAQGALFLASNASSFAVGSSLVLDGGYTIR
jgi:NAD(P)-dependent dehydrogenase (short-subunit alcohol dehydrogenase family)